MKKLITLSILFILTGILLTSCKSGFSSSKRHYTKGYYFARVHGKTAPSHLELNNKCLKTETADQIAEVKVLAEQSPIKTYTPSATITKQAILITSNEKKQGKSGMYKSPKPFIPFTIKNIDSQISHMDPTQLNVKKVGNATRESDGLSLFWIIILVILILWALGLLSGGWGLGGFINILLIIALILLILWLLRVL